MLNRGQRLDDYSCRLYQYALEMAGADNPGVSVAERQLTVAVGFNPRRLRCWKTYCGRPTLMRRGKRSGRVPAEASHGVGSFFQAAF